jgi:DnaK suppressor protein
MPKLSNTQHAWLESEHAIVETSLQRLQTLPYQADQDRHSQEQLQRKLMRIKEAIHRNQTNVYGRCHSCGQTIGRQRLDVLPYAEFCLSCQIKIERTTQQKDK